MQQDEIFKIAEEYRDIRKRVYEQSTCPPNRLNNIHRENQIKLRNKIDEICTKAELERYSGNEPGIAHEIWHHLWTKNRYAGIRAQIATNEINDISSIFDDYTIFMDQEWDIEAHGHNIIRAGRYATNFIHRKGHFTGLQTIGNIPKLVKIVAVARALNTFIRENPKRQALEFITGGNDINDVWSIHTNLMSIGYRADLTALHLMMDIGFQVIKPDIVISKLFLDKGWLHKCNPALPEDLTINDLQGRGRYRTRYLYTKPNVYKPIIDLAREISQTTKKTDLEKDIGWATKNPIRELDIFMVKYGQRPENGFGIERTLFDEYRSPK